MLGKIEMNADLDIIVKGLTDRINNSRDSVDPPLIYLDREAVGYLLQELTGLAGPAGFRIAGPAGAVSVEPYVNAEGAGWACPDSWLFEAMSPVLEKKIPLAGGAVDVDGRVHQLARVKGVLQATRFPDGERNLEIVFEGVRGLLYYSEHCFNSLTRPLLRDDRFFTIFSQVEALLYVHGRSRRTIFYHQSFGDNMEHTWAPVTPVVVRATPVSGADFL